MAEAIEQLVEMVVGSGDAEQGLARVQAGMLARALEADSVAEARRRAARLGPQVQALLDDRPGLDLGGFPRITEPEHLSRFYERLQEELRPGERRALGQYFTPRPIVELMWALALEAVREAGQSPGEAQVVDPAAGSGAFLTAALEHDLHGSQLLGVEILPSAARTAVANAGLVAARTGRGVPRVLEADAYAASTEAALLDHLRLGRSAIVIGNPPYNGTSPLLREPERLASARERLLPFAAHHAPHSGFRDDFAYFFGLAHRLLEQARKPGVICLITPSSVLDARDYLGLRRFLLDRYLVRVVDVGAAAFPDARVSTAITVLRVGRGPARVFVLPAERPAAVEQLTASPADLERCSPLSPAEPDFVLRSVRTYPELEEEVDPVTEVLQRWFTPHKTGFDELLVDVEPDRLTERLRALASDGFAAEGFAQRFGAVFATPRVKAKLVAAREWVRAQKTFPVGRQVQPYLRYNPRHAVFAAPPEQWQHVYFEPRLATLFNHAFKGTLGRFHPHEAKPQLLFNTFEQPLYAQVVERPGVLHLYQHVRFAPLRVPESCYRARGKAASDDQDRGRRVLNFTPAWRERSERLRRPEDLFWLIAGIYASSVVQRLFGPEQGKRVAVPIKRFDDRLAPLAQRIADRTRLLAALEERKGDLGDARRHLDLDVLRLYLGRDASEEEVRRTALGRACEGEAS